jgi:cellulose synthase/poly-beta-1,6-N-acetylglucosamine synthase-like glycosyltransferase
MQWLPAILILPYFFLILRIYRGLLKISPFLAGSDPTTRVSVVVACRNEQDNLPLLLESISAQNFPPALLEVIIVDDNSSDGTFKIASGFKSSFRLTILKNKRRGKKQALRTGIAASSGELIITTDADCRAGNRWIRTIVSFYEMNHPAMIICPVKTDSGSGFTGKFMELEFLSLQGITAGTAALKQGVMCNGANLAFTRETYDKHSHNLHDEIGSGDDIFLLQSLKKEPHAIIEWIESADAIVTTASSGSTGMFFSQRKRWISKWPAFNDRFTIILGIVTFIAILTQLTLCLASLADSSWLYVTSLVFIVKSIPDYLVLRDTTSRYRRRSLMKWFIPSQFVYPFYVITVVFLSLFGKNKD